MMTDEEIIAVVQARMAGKNIQSRLLTPEPGKQYKWMFNPRPTWNFAYFEYRVAPEPFRCWVLVDPLGRTRHYYDETQKEKAVDQAESSYDLRLIHLQEILE